MLDYDNENEYMVVTCDNCGDRLRIEGSWYECIQEAKDQEWVIQKVKKIQDFEHYCPACS